MPVAVDRTRTMTAPDPHGMPAKTAQDIPLAGATQTGLNPRKKRKAKGKEVEDAEEAWAWKSLTDSSASRVPPIFTKDGRCVVFVRARCECGPAHLCAATFSPPRGRP